MPEFIALPEWLPDQLELGNVLVEADNVMAFANGYAPVGQFSAVSDVLSDTFLGGGSFISTDGNAYLLAGGSAGIYRAATGAWTSLVTGLTVTKRWRFKQFGNFAITVNGTTDTRQVDLSSGVQSVIADAPGGVDLAVIGGTNGGHVFIAQPDGAQLDVAWSALNDRSGWTPGTDQSGQETMITGGEVMGLAGGEYGVILQRSRLVRVDSTGNADAPFSFSEITDNYGCASTASIVQAGRSVFFLSDRGFMALEDGQALKPIGNEKFDRHFRETVPRADWEKLYAAVDPRRTIVMWAMPGNPGKAWVYNWALGRATTITTSFDAIFSGYESAIGLDALDAIYGDLDSIPYSLDDARFQGGSPSLYVVKGAQLGLFAGEPLQAYIKQGQASAGDKRLRLRAIWPEIDATSGVTCTVEARQRMGDTVDATVSGTMQYSGRVPLRAAGKYFTPGFTIAAGTNWDLFTGYRLEATPSGVRT